MAFAEKIVWSVPPDLRGVEILSAENNQRLWCVYHDTYTICNIDAFVKEDGVHFPAAAEWTYRRKIHQNPSQTLMLIEPGEVHRNTKVAVGCNFSVLLIDPKLVNDIALEARMRPAPHLRDAVSADPRLYHTFVEFHTALSNETTVLHQQSLLVKCIQALLSGHCEQNPCLDPDPGERNLAWAREFLKEHFSEKISLEQLAEISGLSRYHFLRAFTKRFGLPPHAYQISLRMEKVRQWLKDDVPIRDIEAGFADQSHLTRHFKVATGVTPARYASMVRASPRSCRNHSSPEEEQ